MSSSEESDASNGINDASDDESEMASESEDDSNDRNEIKSDLSTMSFEELMKLKEQLGAKVYKEAVLGETSVKPKKKSTDFKRLNKNRPREQSSRRQVPFLGGGVKTSKKSQQTLRDPRFDSKSGDYDPNKFKENYKFVTEIREKEIEELKQKLSKAKSDEERENIKFVMQRLKNKNVEEKHWEAKQNILKKEQRAIQKDQQEGKQPHFATKKERRAKELVQKFVELKSSGGLAKHLEKKRKKNAAKDRKKFSFD
ncbi:ribosomal RNA processing protein 36 homolog [Episyrphus balteatus]|uniref:ribosomal RNA processing protein 36 homolog n=1 Tax=Episyrphus balteatus TaxID=286459 RepID=UPI0024864E68|nr:ribosomal RNA processing protein 36 homolog [Episyrphus balteatus]